MVCPIDSQCILELIIIVIEVVTTVSKERKLRRDVNNHLSEAKWVYVR